MKLRVTVRDEVLDAVLDDNRAARDFAALLPLTLTLSDFHGTEKISDLPAKLDTTGCPAGTAALPGDLCYYAPWGNVAIFYRDFAHSAGLVRLGRFVSGTDALTAHREPFTARFELAGG